MATTPLINGTNYSWANVKFVVFGVPVTGITKIEYGVKQNKENNYGMGSEPVSRGYGNKEYSAKITIYRDEWQRIINASPGKNPLSIPPFDVQVTFGGNGVTPQCDTLQACEFLEDPFSVGQGDTKILIDIPLIPAGIVHT